PVPPGRGRRWAVPGFFFQAEDGIRGFHVTGVQTCALPISPRRRGAVRGRLPRRGVVTYASWPLSAARRVVSAVVLPTVLPVLRSARSVAAVDVVGGLLLDPVDVVGVPVAGALVDHVPGPFHPLAGLVGVLAEHLLHLVDDGHWRSPPDPSSCRWRPAFRGARTVRPYPFYCHN